MTVKEQFVKACFQVALNALQDRAKAHSVSDKKLGTFKVEALPDGRFDVDYSAGDRGFGGYCSKDKTKTDAENALNWCFWVINMVCDYHSESVQLRAKMEKELLQGEEEFCLEMTE